MIKQSRVAKASAHKLTFALPADHPAGTVSVVGTFNEWTPGAHVLKRRSNGTMSVAVTVPSGTPVCFRYLGENGIWFDDPDAERITRDGGHLSL